MSFPSEYNSHTLVCPAASAVFTSLGFVSVHSVRV